MGLNFLKLLIKDLGLKQAKDIKVRVTREAKEDLAIKEGLNKGLFHNIHFQEVKRHDVEEVVAAEVSNGSVDNYCDYYSKKRSRDERKVKN